MAADKKNALKWGATIVFVDESGFSLVPPTRRTWARRGRTPVLAHRFSWPKLSSISGVTLDGRLYLRLVRDTINGEEILRFFRVLLRHIRGKLIVIWDNGPTHRSRRVKRWVAEHPRLVVEPLPSYAYELNADEGVWEHLKGAPLGNYCPASLEDLEAHLRRCVRRLRNRTEVVRSFFQRTPLAKV